MTIFGHRGLLLPYGAFAAFWKGAKWYLRKQPCSPQYSILYNKIFCRYYQIYVLLFYNEKCDIGYWYRRKHVIKHFYAKSDAKSRIWDTTLVLISNIKLRFFNERKTGSDNKKICAYHQWFIDRTKVCNRIGVPDFKSVIK